MKTALDLLHGVRVELADHGNLSIPSPLRHQYLDFVLLKPPPVQKMRRRSRPASPSDEDAQGDDVVDMADQEEELAQTNPDHHDANQPEGPLFSPILVPWLFVLCCAT
jgi:hypothetical protein